MKLGKIRLAVGILLIVWMGVIFCLSAQPAAQSEMTSGAVSYRIAAAFGRWFGWSEIQDLNYAEIIDHPVRKLAHMTEYAVLGCIWLMFICPKVLLGKKNPDFGFIGNLRKYCLLSAALSAVYAMTDEFHQLFVAGRSGRFIDVCIDTTGALIGVFILAIIIKFHYNNTKYQV